jgi:hypothetical protein
MDTPSLMAIDTDLYINPDGIVNHNIITVLKNSYISTPSFDTTSRPTSSVQSARSAVVLFNGV